ncbi:unnamed protein product [Anisakis simplex]|uniref:DUF3480 domain-containing protein n=1 Tax=Anisakis simplex TaxID=6269 RepID=A0A0M3JD56_ANISI|nr:unnamed protein product [Anisakis simplex]
MLKFSTCENFQYEKNFKGNYEYGLSESRILSSLYPIPGVNEWALRLVAVYNIAKGKFAPLIQSKVFAVSEQIAGQIAYTLVPFTDSLINNDMREICVRIRVSADDAGYSAAKWESLEQEYAMWKDLLDNQVECKHVLLLLSVVFEVLIDAIFKKINVS